MSDLKVLLKYATKSYKPRKGMLNLNGFIGWISLLIICASILAPMILMFYGMFQMLAIPVSKLGLSYNGYLVDIYMFLFPVTFGLMLILTLVPNIIFNVFEADDLALLLSLPIKKWTIFIFKSLMGLSTGIFPLLMLLVSSICYAIVIKLNMFVAILGILLFLLFIFLFSLALGSIMTRFVSKSKARIASQIFLYISLIVYVIVMNVFPKQAENPQAIADSLGRLFSIIEGPNAWLIPTNWALYAIRGDIRTLSIIGFLCIWLIFFVIKTANVANLENGRGKVKKSSKIKISRYPIVKKEIRLLFRNPQNLFSISYAIIFPLIMGYINHSAMSGAIFVGVFTTIYAANLGLQLVAEEIKVWPYLKFLPLDMAKAMQYKAFIPAFIFTAGYGIVLLASYFLIDMHPLMFLSIIPMAVVMLFATSFGLNLFLNDPQRSMTKNVITLKFSESLLLALYNMLLSLGIIIPFQMWSGLYTKGESRLEWLIDQLWYRLVVMGLPWLIMVVAIILIRITFNKINTKLITWE